MAIYRMREKVETVPPIFVSESFPSSAEVGGGVDAEARALEAALRKRRERRVVLRG
ncbi:MAG: hypothetical protein ACOYM3_14400 [Terrimicrobiaceae bacterium]